MGLKVLHTEMGGPAEKARQPCKDTTTNSTALASILKLQQEMAFKLLVQYRNTLKGVSIAF